VANERAAIRQAATQRAEADADLHQAVAEAYGTLTIREIMDAAGVSRPTVYAILRRAGVTLKGAVKT
jgi:AcrR family transcriptional regulator